MDDGGIIDVQLLTKVRDLTKPRGSELESAEMRAELARPCLHTVLSLKQLTHLLQEIVSRNWASGPQPTGSLLT